MADDIQLSRRERILAAAEAEFAAHGYAGARVERIAAGANVNKQLLFHYFGSKAGLHKAVEGAVAGRSAIGSPTGKTPTERLRNLVAQVVGSASGNEAVLPDEWRTTAATALRIAIEDGQRSGHFRDDADPDSIAEVVVAASFGRRFAGQKSQRAGLDQATFAGSLAQMAIDYCSWR